jgi:xanthine dehydrogenase YagS FAD-binding subunit
MIHNFSYARAVNADAAIEASGPDSTYLAGGTDLVQLLKAGVAAPRHIVDINHLPDGDRIQRLGDGRLTIGALARMADVARHPDVHHTWPVVSEALLLSASPQVRNVATIGGNLLQRTRCPYFRDIAMPCNKRAPGSGCPARSGEHRNHAIFGTSEQCMATHASDLAVALTALDTLVHVVGPAGKRSLPLSDLYLLPGDRPEQEVSLSAGDLIVAIELPAAASSMRQSYFKVRDRQSFEFAVVSVACVLDTHDDGTIRRARLAAGGVGTTPWRLSGVEALLKERRPTARLLASAGDAAVEGAKPGTQNRFKIALLRNVVARVLGDLTSMIPAIPTNPTNPTNQ